MKRRGQMGAPQQSVHFESAIPLILIAILAIFLAAKFNVIPVDGVPILNQIVPSGAIKVAVFGDRSKMVDFESMLGSSEFQGVGGVDVRPVFYDKLDAQAVGIIKNVDVVILIGDAYCDRPFRKGVADHVKAGKALIVVGDACTRVRGDNTVIGWDIGLGLLGDVMPVSLPTSLTPVREPVRTYTVTGQFRGVEFDHPILTSVKDFPFSGDVTEVVSNDKGTVLAQIDTGANQRNLYAIVEGKSVIGGKVLYFAFDPAKAHVPNLFKNALLYLKGRRG